MAPVGSVGMRWETLQAAFTFASPEEQIREWAGGIPFANLWETAELLYDWIDKNERVGATLWDDAELVAHDDLNRRIDAVLDDLYSGNGLECLTHPGWAAVVGAAGRLFVLLLENNLRHGQPWPERNENWADPNVVGVTLYEDRKWRYYTTFLRGENPQETLDLLNGTGWRWFFKASRPETGLQPTGGQPLEPLVGTKPLEVLAEPFAPPLEWQGIRGDLVAYAPEDADRSADLHLVGSDLFDLQRGIPSPLRACMYQDATSICHIFPAVDAVDRIEEMIGKRFQHMQPHDYGVSVQLNHVLQIYP